MNRAPTLFSIGREKSSVRSTNILYCDATLQRSLSCLWLAVTRGRNFETKPRPNDRNMSTQRVAILLGATCCARLATLLRNVASCWMLLKNEPKISNMPQQGTGWPNSRNNVAICCVEILRSFDRYFSYDTIRAAVQPHHEPGSMKRFGFKSLPKKCL